MDVSNECDNQFVYVSTAQNLRSLIVNVHYLNSVLRPHVQMGNLKVYTLNSWKNI